MYHGMSDLKKKGWVKEYNSKTELNWWAPKSKESRNIFITDYLITYLCICLRMQNVNKILYLEK
jgi:hypothetical protein